MAHQSGYIGNPEPGSWQEVTENELKQRIQEGIDRSRALGQQQHMQGQALGAIAGAYVDIARQAQNAAQQGRKFDQAKPDYTLLPWDAVEQIVKVLDFGARKYDRNNWKHVDNAENRYLAAAFRHLSAYAQGEVNDSETGLSHLAHAGCCLLFLMALANEEKQ